VPIILADSSWTWPPPVGPLKGNDASLVFTVDGFVFTGDVEAEAEATLAAQLPAACVLKVPHHGSATSTTDPLLEAVHPALAVVSVGPNRYGHPAPTTLQRLGNAGVRVVTTREAGTIVVERSGEGVLVSSDLGVERVSCPGP
jgi:competence protein ComEC